MGRLGELLGLEWEGGEGSEGATGMNWGLMRSPLIDSRWLL